MFRPYSINIIRRPILVAVLISADAEWSVARKFYSGVEINSSPFGEWFQQSLTLDVATPTRNNSQTPAQFQLIFFQGGWGKIAAAASTQYVIDTWKPDLLINLGTCGGFYGQVERFEIILVEETIVYDIFEQMGDPAAHLTHYSSKIELSWLIKTFPPPLPVRQSLLISGDRDLIPCDVPELIHQFGATAGDWESGAIAFTAKINKQRLVILRGVTDLVDCQGGEAYQDQSLFIKNTEIVMDLLLRQFLKWVLLGYTVSFQPH